MRWTIGLLTVITLTLTWSQLMTISAAQQKLEQQSTSGPESLTSLSPSDVVGAGSTAGSSTTATAKANPTITTTGTPTASDSKAQQPSPTPGSLASSLLSGIIISNYYYYPIFFFWLLLFGRLPLITRAVSLARPDAHPGKEAQADADALTFILRLFKYLMRIALAQWIRPVGSIMLEKKNTHPIEKKGKQLTVSLDDVFVLFSKYF
jgi:hypothetical protein